MLGFVSLQSFLDFFTFANADGDSQSTNNTNNNSTGNTNIGNGGGNNKKNDLKIFFIVGLAVFLLIMVFTITDYHNKHFLQQCDDPSVIETVKGILKQNPEFAKTNFGIDVKKPFDISALTEFAPADKTIRKRFCEGLINNKTDIKFTIHATPKGDDAIIWVLPNTSNILDNLLNSSDSDSSDNSKNNSNSDVQDNSPSYNNQDTTMPDTSNTFNNNSDDDNNN